MDCCWIRALQATSEDNKVCLDFRDDYIECLHHRKEVSEPLVCI